MSGQRSSTSYSAKPAGQEFQKEFYAKCTHSPMVKSASATVGSDLHREHRAGNPGGGPVRLVERSKRQASELGHRLRRGGERTHHQNHEADDEEQHGEVKEVDA